MDYRDLVKPATFVDDAYFHELTTHMWSAFVKWMAYFHSDKVMEQEITEIALRRAQVLRP